jgi:cbb3-type cytochrome oxidase maturation protein
MDSLYLLIPIALIFCAIAIRLLIWAIDSGQYDDLDKDAWRILAEPPPETGGDDTRESAREAESDSDGAENGGGDAEPGSDNAAPGGDTVQHKEDSR